MRGGWPNHDMNRMMAKAAATGCVMVPCTQAAAADGATVTRWQADTTDPERFAGTVTITETRDGMTLDYAFVYDAQIISMNAASAAMQPLGADCWRADLTGAFMLDIAGTFEVLFCQRDDQAYWSLLDTRGGAVRLPAWASFSRS